MSDCHHFQVVTFLLLLRLPSCASACARASSSPCMHVVSLVVPECVFSPKKNSLISACYYHKIIQKSTKHALTAHNYCALCIATSPDDDITESHLHTSFIAYTNIFWLKNSSVCVCCVVGWRANVALAAGYKIECDQQQKHIALKSQPVQELERTTFSVIKSIDALHFLLANSIAQCADIEIE